MKLHRVITLLLIFITPQAYGGGFGKQTIIKVLPRHVDPYCLSKEVLKRSIRLGALHKRNMPVRVPTYDFFYASKFPDGPEGKVPLFKNFLLKEELSQKLVGIILTKERTDSCEFDIVCHEDQRFYKGTCYANYYPSPASSLKKGDFLACLKATSMEVRKIHKVYTLYNDQGTMVIPQTKVPLCLLVSRFGVASYVEPTIEIIEEN